MTKKPIEIEWPQFNKESDRLKYYTARFKNKQIVDAFHEIYPDECPSNLVDQVNKDERSIINNPPQDPKVGGILTVTMRSVSKDGVILDCPGQKKAIHTKSNLYKYKRFKTPGYPLYTIESIVLEKDKNSITVDLLTPLFHNWLDPMLRHPEIQRPTMCEPTPVHIRNLRLVNGGFMGKALVPTLTEFLGEPFEVDTFIPGSNITLNIAEDFNKYNGVDVDAFVINYVPKNINGEQKMILICSVKEYLKYKGTLNMINLYDKFVTGEDGWGECSDTVYKGKVTGVIHSANKCGVFVEIPDMYITGLISVKPELLVNYSPHSEVDVKIDGFELDNRYNSITKQTNIWPPYKLDESGHITYSNFKPILKLV